MKNLRITIPYCNEWNPMPWGHTWLKVCDDGEERASTVAYKDREFTSIIDEFSDTLAIEVEVPSALSIIEVVPPGGTTPDGDIAFFWGMANPNGFNGLERVAVFFPNAFYEVPVENGMPDIKDWNNYREKEEPWTFMNRWALAVYVFEKDTIGIFNWHAGLTRN